MKTKPKKVKKSAPSHGSGSYVNPFDRFLELRSADQPPKFREYTLSLKLFENGQVELSVKTDQP